MNEAQDLFSELVLNVLHAERKGDKQEALTFTAQAFGAWEMAGRLGQPIGETFSSTLKMVKDALLRYEKETGIL